MIKDKESMDLPYWLHQNRLITDLRSRRYMRCLRRKSYNLKVLFRGYYLLIKRITKSAIIAKISTKDVKLVKTNISFLNSNAFTKCICLLECKNKILVFTILPSDYNSGYYLYKVISFTFKGTIKL